jgi:hypothetical protein
MGWLIAPVALVRAIMWTAVLLCSLGRRHPVAAVVVLAVLWVGGGGRW